MESSTSSSVNIVKICRVCGDKALGFNFNGLTCESCKSFFRRNALKFDKYSCRKEEKCPIDFVTRKCCTRCRLVKCFTIGMKKELICSKMDKDTAGSPSSSNSNAEIDSSESSPLGQLSNSSIAPHIEGILEADIRTKLSMCSMLYPLAPNETVLDNSKTNPTKKAKYVITLNAQEEELLKEIQHATDMAAFYDENRLQVIGEVTDLIYALNLAELYIKKTIKFCKSITAFKCLNQEDQLVILKGFFTELMIVRFAFVFNPEKDGYPVIEDETRKQAVFIKLNLLYEAKRQNVLFYCRQYSIRFHAELEDDSAIRDLILAQRLFKPRENTSCPEFIRYQYSLYHRLLNRYLEHKYQNSEKAIEKVKKLTEILNEMNPVKDILEGLFIQSDANQLALVLNEVYNLS